MKLLKHLLLLGALAAVTSAGAQAGNITVKGSDTLVILAQGNPAADAVASQMAERRPSDGRCRCLSNLGVLGYVGPACLPTIIPSQPLAPG